MLSDTKCRDLWFDKQISKVLATRTWHQRLYLICLLKLQGLSVSCKQIPVSSTEIVFNALVLGKILYALPMLYNYPIEYSKNQIRALSMKVK